MTNAINGNEQASDMENPCKYLLSEAVKGMPFHDLNGWAKWGFAQYSFYLYFHKLGINPEFYPRLFESLRRKPLSRQAYEVSEAHLALYERICNISRTDFTDDFEILIGLSRLTARGINMGITVLNDRGNGPGIQGPHCRQTVPQTEISHCLPASAWKDGQFVGAESAWVPAQRLLDQIQAERKTQPVCKRLQKDNMIIVRNGENAAAFCVVTNGKVVGYYDRQKFDVSGVEWNDTSKVYAIPIQTAEPYKLIYAAGRS